MLPETGFLNEIQVQSRLQKSTTKARFMFQTFMSNFKALAEA